MVTNRRLMGRLWLRLAGLGGLGWLVWLAPGTGLAVELTPQQIYAQAAPAVVFVAAFSDDKQMAGTGSIVNRDGYVLTNAHVVIDPETGQPFDRVWVFLKPERVTGHQDNDFSRRVKGQVVAYDVNLDLAAIKLEPAPQPLPVLPLGDPRPVQIGARVVAIGHPEQGGLWTLTTGVISAEFEDFQEIRGKHVFQTETSLNRGNSGGPLLDAEGHQIGVNTAIARKAKDGLAITAISFALKSSVARDWLAQQGVQVAYAPVAAATPPPTKPAEPAPAPAQLAPPKPQPKPAAPVPPSAPSAGGPPPARPYNLDQLVKGLDRVEKEMESLMDEMRNEIRARERR